MQKRLLLLLLAAFLIAGCATVSAPAVPSSNNTQPQSQQPAQASTGLAVPARDPLVCAVGDQPVDTDTYHLLVRLAHYAPVQWLVGHARETEQQWNALESQGWPPSNREDWAAEAWRGLKVSADANGAYRLALTYGPKAATATFQVRCVDGFWRVSEEGNQYGWTPVPAGIPGQDGSLTPALAKKLVEETQNLSGPYLTWVATGTEVELGRIQALKKADGWDKISSPWMQSITVARVKPQDQDHATAECTDNSGKSLGDCLRFVRENGLWKLENHTWKGEWLHGTISGAGLPVDLKQSIFGLTIGAARTAVEQAFGQPDERVTTPSGDLYRYNLRDFEVQFDQGGKVAAVTIRSGATSAGIMVGAPISMVEVLWGPRADHAYAFGTDKTLQFAVQNGQIQSITMTRK